MLVGWVGMKIYTRCSKKTKKRMKAVAKITFVYVLPVPADPNPELGEGQEERRERERERERERGDMSHILQRFLADSSRLSHVSPTICE